MGSEATVKGLAIIRAVEEMTRLYSGQSLSMPTPGAYLVPRVKAWSCSERNRSGTLSGGCCRSASMQTRYWPWASWKPLSTAEDRPRSVVLTMMRTL